MLSGPGLFPSLLLYSSMGTLFCAGLFGTHRIYSVNTPSKISQSGWQSAWQERISNRLLKLSTALTAVLFAPPYKASSSSVCFLCFLSRSSKLCESRSTAGHHPNIKDFRPFLSLFISFSFAFHWNLHPFKYTNQAGSLAVMISVLSSSFDVNLMSVWQPRQIYSYFYLLV